MIMPFVILYFFLKRSCGANAQKVVQRLDNPINVWGIRISFILGLISSIVSGIYYDTFTIHWPDEMDKPIKIFGVVLCYIADASMIWTLYHLGRMWTMVVSKVDDAELVTSGPYRFA